MKFKKLTAVLLSAATLLSLPRIPIPNNPLAQLEDSISLKAEAADEYRGTTTVNSCTYKLYFGSTGLYAVLTSVPDSLTQLTVPGYVKYNNKSYAVQKIAPYVCQNNYSIVTIDLSKATQLQEIGAHAFHNANRVDSAKVLKTVKLPNTLVTIGDYAFSGNTYLTNCNIPTQLITLGSFAFSGTGLSGEISLGAKLRKIDGSAFYNSCNISKYSVSGSNYYYTSVEGVLYNYARTSLVSYPPQKASDSYTVISTYISNNAFSNSPNLKRLDISKCAYNSNVFESTSQGNHFPNLEELTIPATELQHRSLLVLISRYHQFFYMSRLLTLNGKRIVVEEAGKEPVIHPEFRTSVQNNFVEMSYKSLYFLNYYKEAILNYVVNTVTTPNMTDMQKAIRLHNWVLNRVMYDPDEEEYWDSLKPGDHADINAVDMKNHHELAIFLHYDTKKCKDGKDRTTYYAVCEGIAKGYLLLLEKAGIESYYVDGDNHAWTLLNINGNYYHVDISGDNDMADSSNTIQNRFMFFMKSDNEFKNNEATSTWDVPGNHHAWYSMSSLGNKATNAAVKRLQSILNGSQASEEEGVIFDLDFNKILDARDLSLLKQYYNNRSTYNVQYGSVANWMFNRLS